MEVNIHYVDLERLVERGIVPLGMSDEVVSELFADGVYEHVAILRVTGLDEAFRITQNGIQGTESWAFDGSPEIVSVLRKLRAPRGVKPGLRSSMVGDIFEVDGTAFLVDTLGFRDLGPAASLSRQATPII